MLCLCFSLHPQDIHISRVMCTAALTALGLNQAIEEVQTPEAGFMRPFSVMQVAAHVEDAVSKGATVTIGGKKPDLPEPYNKVHQRRHCTHPGLES